MENLFYRGNIIHFNGDRYNFEFCSPVKIEGACDTEFPPMRKEITLNIKGNDNSLFICVFIFFSPCLDY